MEYTIYHIPAKKKIGLTYRNPKIRVREQGYKEFEILEVHTDYNTAINRELELQKEYGYKLDNAKYDLDRLSANGKINGSINGKLNKGRPSPFKGLGKSKKPKSIGIPVIKYSNPKYNSALTEDEVRFIRNSKLKQTQLAKIFNTTQVTIHNVKKHKLYKWVV